MLTNNYGELADGSKSDYRKQEAQDRRDLSPGARLEVQVQAGLHRVHGPAVSTYLTNDGCLLHHDPL